MARKDLSELRDEQSHMLRSAEDMVQKADKAGAVLSEAERKTVNEYMAKAHEIQAEIDDIELSNKTAAEVAAALENFKAPQERISRATNPGADPVAAQRRMELGPEVIRDGKLRAFKGHNAEYNAYLSGQFIRATFFKDYRADKWLQQNISHDWRNAMSEGTNSAGGYLVPSQMLQTIIDNREEYGVFRRECNVVQMGSDTLDWPRVASRISASFTTESTAGTESQAAFSSIKLVAKKAYAFTAFSSELSEDAVISLGDYVADGLAYAFALLEDQCGFIGDGSVTYDGIHGIVDKFTDNTTFAGYVDCASGHDSVSEIDNADITNLMGKLPMYALNGAKFYCSQVVAAGVFGRLKATAGGNSIQSLGGGIWGDYLGYPVVVTQTMTSTTTATALNNVPFLMFGRLDRACTMGERRGVRIQQSEHYRFPQDQVCVMGTERFDINVHDIGDATNAGPVVALVGAT